MPSSVKAVIPIILEFVGPPFRAVSEGGAFSKRWAPTTRTWRSSCRREIAARPTRCLHRCQRNRDALIYVLEGRPA